jgi:uncharacterized protein (DUF58 family)
LYSRFLYLSVLLSLLSWGWTRWAASGLAVERRTRELRANVGDVFEEQFTCSTTADCQCRGSRSSINPRCPLRLARVYSPSCWDASGRNYLARSWLTRRGGFPLGPTRITTGDPFGLFTAGKIPCDETLIVFPVIHEDSGVSISAWHVARRTGHQRKSYGHHARMPAGVREYVHGDAMKRIHWRTSARRGQLMVKEFEQDPQAEIWLYLDSQ